VEGITLEGPPGEAFARSRGLEVESRLHALRLDLTRAVTVDVELPPGVDEIIPLDRAPDLARSAWEVTAEGQADLPGGAAGDVAPFAAWNARRLTSSATSRALSLVALSDNLVVGWAALDVRDGDPSVGLHELTAVRRAWRRRGVATALKRHQIARARELGLAWLHASNDAENAGIRSVNHRLGYHPQPVRVWMRGLLPEGD
jgi:GNAT superfamily N-acetyltransferase